MYVWKSWRDALGDLGATAIRWRRLFLKEFVEFSQISAPTTPAADRAKLYVGVSGGVSKLYFKDEVATVTDLTGGAAANTLDAAYDTGGVGSGRTIVADGGAVAISNTAADNNGLLTLNKTPVGSQSGDLMTITAGANCTGDCLQFANAGTGSDVKGSDNSWSISKTGTAVLPAATITAATLTSAAIAAITGTVDASAAVLAGTNALVFDGSTAGTNATTLAVTDPTANRTITLPNATGTVRLRNTATHDYGAAAVTWTLTAAEQECSFISVSNASAPVIAQLSAAMPGMSWLIYNNSGQVLTWKVTGQTGATLAAGKYGFYGCGAADVIEIWEQS